MTTQVLSPAQAKLRNNTADDPVEDLVSIVSTGAAKLLPDGLHLPEIVFMGDHGPVMLLEDRDKHTKQPRSRRFDKSDFEVALGEARSISILLYGPRKRSVRLGVAKQAIWHAFTLQSRLMDGGALLVLTTSDRLRFWATAAVAKSRRGTSIEFYDANGVMRIAEGGL